MLGLMKDIGAIVKMAVGLVPLNGAAATRNGAAIDRQGFNSAVLWASTGVTEGTPTSFTYDAKLEDSADGSTGWAALVGAAITQIVAASTAGYKDVDLSSAKRYIRAVDVIAFVGGTSPKLNAAVAVVLGGADVLPAA